MGKRQRRWPACSPPSPASRGDLLGYCQGWKVPRMARREPTGIDSCELCSVNANLVPFVDDHRGGLNLPSYCHSRHSVYKRRQNMATIWSVRFDLAWISTGPDLPNMVLGQTAHFRALSLRNYYAKWCADSPIAQRLLAQR